MDIRSEQKKYIEMDMKENIQKKYGKLVKLLFNEIVRAIERKQMKYEELLELVASEMEKEREKGLITDDGFFYSEALMKWIEEYEDEILRSRVNELLEGANVEN